MPYIRVLPLPTRMEALLHIRHYYMRYILPYGIDIEDIAQEALCLLLGGAASLNSACRCAVAKELRHAKREVPCGNLEVTHG